MSYCGFIDLLGTKSLAEHSIDDLRAHLEWFHATLLDNFNHYKNGTCIAASDGAFFENRRLNDFYPFYKRVRNYLFDKGVFFKCSYIPGSIEFLKAQIDGTGQDASKLRFLSLNFLQGASEAYGAEARLKGVGCAVTAKNKGKVPANSLSNYFLSKEGNKYIPKEFLDYGFTAYEVSSDGEKVRPGWKGQQRLVDKIFYYMSLTAIESEHNAVKYIPLLVNAIRSSNFRGAQASKRTWINAPYILRRIVAPQSALSGFSRVPGLKFVVLSLYDKMYADNCGELHLEAENKLVRFIASRRDWQANLGSIPSFVLEPRSRKSLVQSLTRIRGVPILK